MTFKFRHSGKYNHHANRGFGSLGTVPDDMGHDGKALWARDLETAALSY
ncbi:hypothetical protein ACFLYL_04690 [Chloroflexota bacterium]